MNAGAVTAAIWIIASVALVALLAYTGYRLVRGVLRILVDLSDLATTTAKLDNVQATRELDRPQPAAIWPGARTRGLVESPRVHPHEARGSQAFQNRPR